MKDFLLGPQLTDGILVNFLYSILVLSIGVFRIVNKTNVKWVDDLSKKVRGIKTDKKSTDLKGYSNIKIGGRAACVFQPTGSSIDEVTEELMKVVNFCRGKGIRYWTIGNASNTIFGTKVDGVVILNKRGFGECDVNVNDGVITAEAGVYMPRLSRFAHDNSLSGLEYAVQLPGCLGGSIVMNAACDILDKEATYKSIKRAFTGGKYYGPFDFNVFSVRQSTSDIVEEVTIIDTKGNLRVLKKDDLNFDSRHSSLQFGDYRGAIVVSAKLKLEQKDRGQIKKLMRDYIAKRKMEKQPLGKPSLGSVFIKKGYVLERGKCNFGDYTIESLPSDDFIRRAFGTISMGEFYSMVDSDLDPENPIRAGGICMVPQCPSFFVNDGTGTLRDFKKLYRMVFEGVRKKTGIKLMPEVKFIPEEIALKCARISSEDYNHWKYRSYLRRGVDLVGYQPDVALRYLDQALEYKPDGVAALINKGFSLGLLGEWEKAREIFEDIHKHNKFEDILKHNKGYDDRIPFFLGYCYHSLGIFDKALFYYNEYFEGLPPLERAGDKKRNHRKYLMKRANEFVDSAKLGEIKEMGRHGPFSFASLIISE